MNALQTVRVLDQQIDRSLLPIDATEKAKYQFIWDMSSRPRRRTEADADAARRQPRDDDERTLTSVATDCREKKSTSSASIGESLHTNSSLLDRMQQACLRSVKAPRKQMKKFLSKDRKPSEQSGNSAQLESSGERRSSEATLVERLSRKMERQKSEK